MGMRMKVRTLVCVAIRLCSLSCIWRGVGSETACVYAYHMCQAEFTLHIAGVLQGIHRLHTGVQQPGRVTVAKKIFTMPDIRVAFPAANSSQATSLRTRACMQARM